MDKLKHAKHNESVCRYLTAKQDFADWVVTTAFYSAIHFVEFKLFPYKIDGSTFPTLESYYLSSKKIFPGRDKHGTRVDLVRMHCNEISAAFNWLFSTCNTARYVNFEFSKPREISSAALANLKIIKDHCTKK